MKISQKNENKFKQFNYDEDKAMLHNRFINSKGKIKMYF